MVSIYSHIMFTALLVSESLITSGLERKVRKGRVGKVGNGKRKCKIRKKRKSKKQRPPSEVSAAEICKVKVKETEYSSSQHASPLRELTCHMGSQCYMPPSRADIPAFTPAEASTRLSNTGGMQG